MLSRLSLCRHSRASLSQVETVTLTPWEKRQRGYFPYQILLHLFILILLVLQIFLLASQFTAYNRASEATFQAVFRPSEFQAGFVTIEDTLDAVRFVVEKYYAFPTISVDRYQHLHDEQGQVLPVDLTVIRYTGKGPYFNYSNYDYKDEIHVKESYFRTQKEHYRLTNQNPLGEIFNGSKADQPYYLQSIFYSILALHLHFSFYNLDIGYLAVLPYEWNIQVSFNFGQGGHVSTSIFTDLRLIRAGVGAYDWMTLLQFILVVLTSCSIILDIRILVSQWKFYTRTQGRHAAYVAFAKPEDRFTNWKEMPLYLKLHFFSLWVVADTVGSLIILLSVVLGLATEFGWSASEYYNILKGAGVLWSWLHLLEYMGLSKTLYSLSLTWVASIKRTTMFLVVVSPIFIGYALFGMLNFSQYSSRFRNFDESCVSLFSLLLGDDIHDTFNDIIENSYPYPAVSRIFLYTFVTFFFTSVLNVFIFIIEDAYHISKKGHQNTQHKDRNYRYDDDTMLKSLLDTINSWEEAKLNAEDSSGTPETVDEDGSLLLDTDQMMIPLGRLDTRKPTTSLEFRRKLLQVGEAIMAEGEQQALTAVTRMLQNATQSNVSSLRNMVKSF